jgi:serine-type D-Ala-D-Ala carboxypeptidase (penicillin-binding protein 5/6)
MSFPSDNARVFAGFPSRLIVTLAGSAVLSLILAVASSGIARSQMIETSALQALMVDHDTGTVLLSKEIDESVIPASMAKLMTLEIAFTAIAEGRLSLDDEFFVSEHAWRTGGAPSRTATMFANVNSNVALSDLLHGIMVQGANDACIAIAEGMAGTEEAFAELMNERAEELGLSDSYFTNSTGLPDPEGTRATVSDLMALTERLIDEHGTLYRIFSEPEFTWNGIRQLNRNPLSGHVDGLDGLLAGYSEESGYGIAASAVQEGQRINLVMHGLPRPNARVAEAQRLFSWAWRSFERVELFGAGETVGEVGVYGGEQGRVALASPEPIAILVPRGERANMRGRIVYTGPLSAPVREGDPVGVLRIQNEEMTISEAPLYATETVAVGPLHRRAFDAALELVIGLVHSGVEAATSR